MMTLSAQAWSSGLAAFLASLVEFVEALTVVLAVGAVRGWKAALTGSAAAAAVLLLAVAVSGPMLMAIPLAPVRLAVGLLTLLFGLRWLRKAILRAAGIIPLHDEALAYTRQTVALKQLAPIARGWDRLAFMTAFKITAMEGLEVVFIVIAVGAADAALLLPASVGALAALLLVVFLGAAIHKPLIRIPENTLKFGVGVMLSAFGAFWVGEGIGLHWLQEDWSLPALMLGFLAAALLAVRISRLFAKPTPQSAPANAGTKQQKPTTLRVHDSLLASVTETTRQARGGRNGP